VKDKDCLFCKIIKGEIPSKNVYEDEKIVAFYDINPQAPKHILICPKKHIDKVVNFSGEDRELIGEVIFRAKEIAKQEKIGDGFRLVFNNGSSAGQMVWHIHCHLLGGRNMTWPPG